MKLSSSILITATTALLAFTLCPTATTAFVVLPGSSVPGNKAALVRTTTVPVRGGAVAVSMADDDDAILAVDAAQAKTTIAQNWGWILSSGILNVIGGTMALVLPITGSEFAVAGISWVLAMLGMAGIGGCLFGVAEDGFKAKSLLFGCANLYLLKRMTSDPLGSLGALTVYISSMVIGEGLHETLFALSNEFTTQRTWNFFSGVSSIAVGAFALLRMPVSSLVVPGIALGINFITSGMAKIAIGLAGKDEASTRMGYS